ncbi:hypothetical protein WSK_1884 [Novosphingobium sp. Rr 2-17]|nr:hypothetical protein WSK_1884 [Novosphingobium sp. Rr 2-17]
MRQVETRAAGVSLLFPAGSRPTQDRLAQLLASSGETGFAARISHRPRDDLGWLELLVSGLTFDIAGLAPGKGDELVEGEHRYGFDDAPPPTAPEAITLVPSGHISAGATLDPVLRAMAGLAANLALNLPVAAVQWHSARTVMEPRYFARVVLNWLAGGAFPALGLTALVPAPDGSITSDGLAHFTGQEIQLQGRAGEARADTVKLAIRLVDHFVQVGRITHSQTIEAGDHRLVAEPSQVSKRVLIWRET